MYYYLMINNVNLITIKKISPQKEYIYYYECLLKDFKF